MHGESLMLKVVWKYLFQSKMMLALCFIVDPAKFSPKGRRSFCKCREREGVDANSKATATAYAISSSTVATAFTTAASPARAFSLNKYFCLMDGRLLHMHTEMDAPTAAAAWFMAEKKIIVSFSDFLNCPKRLRTSVLKLHVFHELIFFHQKFVFLLNQPTFVMPL